MAIVVGEVDFEREADLFEIGKADRLLALLLGAGQRRQQQRGEDGDDGNDDEQFNQCKCADYKNYMKAGALGHNQSVGMKHQSRREQKPKAAAQFACHLWTHLAVLFYSRKQEIYEKMVTLSFAAGGAHAGERR